MMARLLRQLRAAAPLLFAGGLFFLFVAFPLARFLSLAHAGTIFSDVALRNTVGLGIAAALFATVPAVALAWVSERYIYRAEVMTQAAVWSLLAIPSYLLTLGWQIVFASPTGALFAWRHVFFGLPGIVFLLTIKGLPFAYLSARSAIRLIGPGSLEAIQALGLTRARALQVLARMMLPAVAAAMTIVFVETIQEFGIPATLGVDLHLPLLTYAIYERLATTPPDFGGAATLSVVLMVLVVVASLAYLAIYSRHRGASLGAGQSPTRRTDMPRVVSAAAFSAATLLLVAGAGVPLAALCYAALAHDPHHVSLAPLLYSGLLGASAAALTLALALPILLSRAFHGRFTTLAVEGLGLLSMALPGIVLGAAYTGAFNGGRFALYGTPLLLIVAYVATSLPMLLRLLRVPLTQIHPHLREAAALHVPSADRRWLDIEAPLIAGPVAWGYSLVCLTILFELPLSALLAPAGREPLAVAIMNRAASLDYTGASRLALVALVTPVLLILISLPLRRGASRHRTIPGGFLHE